MVSFNNASRASFCSFCCLTLRAAEPEHLISAEPFYCSFYCVLSPSSGERAENTFLIAFQEIGNVSGHVFALQSGGVVVSLKYVQYVHVRLDFMSFSTLWSYNG